MTEEESISLEYRGRLNLEAGDRPPLVFVHGAGGAATMWLKQLQYFKPRRSTLAVFLPGHGSEGGQGRESVAEYAEAVRQFLDEMGLSKVALVGLSMGGAIAQLFALTYPERLAGLVLVSTGAKLKVMPQIFEAITKDYKGYLKLASQFSFAKSTPEEARADILDDMEKQKPSVVTGDFKACDAFDARERLQEIQAPTLVVSADQDLLTPPKYSDYLVEHIPGAKLVRITGAGHLLPVEKPEEFNRVLDAFLQEIA